MYTIKYLLKSDMLSLVLGSCVAPLIILIRKVKNKNMFF